MTTNTVTVAETVYMLRNHLGPGRNWANFLADNIRGRQCAGPTLLPCAKHENTNGAPRPVYDLTEICDFIDAVQAADPTARPAIVRTIPLPVNHARGWRVNKFDRAGKALLCRINWAGAKRVH